MRPIQYRDGEFKAGDLIKFQSRGRITIALLLEDPQPPQCGNYPFSFKVLHDPAGCGEPRVELFTERNAWPKEKLS
jgi:hypothetical protein